MLRHLPNVLCLAWCSATCAGQIDWSPIARRTRPMDLEEAKRHVLTVIERMGPGAHLAAPAVVRIAETEPESRLAVLQVLSAIGSREVTTFLRSCLDARDEAVRLSAAELLVHTGMDHEKVASPLIGILLDTSPRPHDLQPTFGRSPGGIRARALEALVQLGSTAEIVVPCLLELLDSGESEPLRFALLQSLARIDASARDSFPELPWPPIDLTYEMSLRSRGAIPWVKTSAPARIVEDVWSGRTKVILPTEPERQPWPSETARAITDLLVQRILHSPEPIPAHVLETLEHGSDLYENPIPALCALFQRGEEEGARAASIRMRTEWALRSRPRPAPDHLMVRDLRVALLDPSPRVVREAERTVLALALTDVTADGGEPEPYDEEELQERFQHFRECIPPQMTCATGYDFRPYQDARAAFAQTGSAGVAFLEKQLMRWTREGRPASPPRLPYGGWATEYEATIRALEVMEDRAARATPVLLEALVASPQHREDIVRALTAAGPGAIPFLTEFLQR